MFVLHSISYTRLESCNILFNLSQEINKDRIKFPNKLSNLLFIIFVDTFLDMKGFFSSREFSVELLDKLTKGKGKISKAFKGLSLSSWKCYKDSFVR